MNDRQLFWEFFILLLKRLKTKGSIGLYRSLFGGAVLEKKFPPIYHYVKA